MRRSDSNSVPGTQLTVLPSTPKKAPQAMLQAVPAQDAPAPSLSVADSMPESSDEILPIPNDSPVAVSIPIPKNVRQFRSVQQPNLADTDSVIASATPSHSMRPANSNLAPEARVAVLPSASKRTPQAMLAQPTELAATSDSPAQAATGSKVAALPPSNGANRLLQQPESILSSFVPVKPIYTVAHPPKQTPAVAAAPAPVRVPDTMLPITPLEADTASVQHPSSTQHASASGGNSSGAQIRTPDSMLPAENSTASRTLWQPNIVR
jgi:hypothetical protein